MIIEDYLEYTNMNTEKKISYLLTAQIKVCALGDVFPDNFVYIITYILS